MTILATGAARAALAAGLLLAAGGLARASALDGTWLTESHETQVRFAPCGAAECGTIVWLKQPRNDAANPDAGKRSRPLIGTVFVYDLKPDGAQRWSGRLYNFENGKTYDGSLELKDANALKLSGCMLGGLLCRSQTWTRLP
ncbi:DUF2147 domain-containing protein [Pseudoxanthobacter sp.]|uniref:DUF2147 domain-containing protein n=1 Tax=Pseudoxanthobacter sp. TaxID=1925742 RepID=UPI002FE2510F